MAHVPAPAPVVIAAPYVNYLPVAEYFGPKFANQLAAMSEDHREKVITLTCLRRVASAQRRAIVRDNKSGLVLKVARAG